MIAASPIARCIALSTLLVALASALRADEPYPTIYPDGIDEAAEAFIENLENDWGDAGVEEKGFLSKWVGNWQTYWRSSGAGVIPRGVSLYQNDRKGRMTYYLAGFEAERKGRDPKAVWKRGSFGLGRDGGGFQLSEAVDLKYEEMHGRSWLFLPGFNWIKRNVPENALLQFAAFMYEEADDRQDYLLAANAAMTMYFERKGGATSPEGQEALRVMKDFHEWGDAFLEQDGREFTFTGKAEFEFKFTLPKDSDKDVVKDWEKWCEAEVEMFAERVEERGESLALSWIQLLDEVNALINTIDGSEFLKAQEEAFGEYEAETDKRDKEDLLEELVEDKNVFALKQTIETQADAVTETLDKAEEFGGKEEWEDAVAEYQKVYGGGDVRKPLDVYYFQGAYKYAVLLQKAAKPDRFYKRVDHEHHAKASVEVCEMILRYRKGSVRTRVVKSIGHLMLQEFGDAEDELDTAEGYPYTSEADQKSIDSWRRTLENLVRSR